MSTGALQTPSQRELQRLRSAVRALQRTSIRRLRQVDFVADAIRQAGLVFDSRGVYGRDRRYMNHGQFGLWQIPSQLAASLVELSHYEIKSLVEIGTWSGWTITIMAAYLRRFQPQMRVTTVDIGHCWGFRDHLVVPMQVHTGTSADLRGQTFDLAFIDGDHSYAACATDYENVGRQASICMFHDINDEHVSAYKPNQGGVPRFWAEVKSSAGAGERTIEYLDQSQGRSIMGIGVIIEPWARRTASKPEQQKGGWLGRWKRNGPPGRL